MTKNFYLAFLATLLGMLTVVEKISAEQIVVINSYHASYPWSVICHQGFEENLNPEHQITYFEMDTKRIPQSEFQKKTNIIWEKLEAIEPQLVVTMDDNALKYFGQRVVKLGVPLVFMGVNNNPRTYFAEHSIPTNVAGVLERPLLQANVNLIAKLLSLETNKILLMMDNGTTSNSFIEYEFSGGDSLPLPPIILDAWMTESYAAWQRKVNSLTATQYDALIIGSYASLIDESGQQVPDVTIAEWTSQNSSIPMFTLWNHGTGKGKAIGGVVINGYDQGASAAKAVNSIIETGEAPYFELPRNGQVLFSHHELKRWNMTVPEYLKNRSQFVD